MSDAPESTTEQKAARSVKRGSTLVLLLILGTFSWYLFADRLTPYTQQARVQGFVVGVAPKVSGILTEVWVKNNQEVEAGQRLFQVDRSSYEIALAQARAGLADARARLAAAKAAVEVARSRLTSALANEEKARKDAERQERLHRKDPGAISVRRVEVAQATLKEAQAKVAGARADLKKAQENARGAEEKLSAAQSTVDKAELDLKNTLVTAETDGVITDLQADVGHYAAQGQAVMTLVAIQSVWIQAQYTENNLAYLEPGTPVEFVLDVQPGKVFRGSVASIGLGVSAGTVPPAGTLPTINNSRDWLRTAQRFPVVVHFDKDQEGLERHQLRGGGQVDVIAYTEEAHLLGFLGKAFIRFMSWMSYIY